MNEYDDQERYYTQSGEIYHIFRTLQTAHATINIQFNNTGPLYSSLVVDTILKKKIILLDEFNPSVGNYKAVGRTPFSIHASLNGVKIHCSDNVIITSFANDTGILFRIPFPDRLLYLQRRDAYRAAIPGSLGIEARCSSNTRTQTLVARVLNISSTGFRMALGGQPSPEIKPGEQLETQIIGLMEDEPMECIINIAHCRYDEVKDKTFCGCQFINLHAPSQMTTNQFVAQLQRQQA